MKNHFTKYLGILFISALSLTLSCKKDAEQVETDPTTLIIGEWSISNYEPNITINGVNLEAIPPQLLGLSEIENQLLTLFLSPGSSSLLEEITIEFKSGGMLGIKSEEFSENNLNYELINENQLVIAIEDQEDIILEIIELTSTNMEILTRQQLLIDLTENGQNEVLEATLRIVLTKKN